MQFKCKYSLIVKNISIKAIQFSRIVLIQTIQFSIVIYKALCFDVAQGQMNGATNETQTHSCRFVSQAC